MADAARISVRVTARGGRDTIVGWLQETLSVRVAAAPVDGAANASLIRLLSRRMNVPPSSFSVVAGVRSRVKVVEVRGVSQAEAQRRLGMHR